ncbi:sulfurtransferase [Tepidibacter thalassicus]|uniref:Thiosulfate/3-mercaptopyruvate sulfurtransferase n=1 Tax=Tepidibacter thalassicus DSM 15285 TaxID=1123350 RepID=A0A1M5T8M4_9FIRM|nr:sulfurtransferase [Tepidibacter thalassicus]SHH47071.1 thiosulfate/3-mercaptopyruvate sulfurtransferase [Tepidibacter thalassicus DSM 15285]
MKNLVSVEWLKNNIDKENLVVVDCRFDLQTPSYGKDSYQKGHIKGAFYMDMNKDLAGEVEEHGGRHPLPDLNIFKEKIENIGIGNNTIVVAYDDGEIAGASRFWWILKYLGHEKVYILSGGIKKWVEKKYPLTQDIPSKNKKEFNINLNEQIIVDMFEVREKKDKENVIIVDSRSKERYRGEFEPIDKVAGHIPGAKNYFWKDVLENNELKEYNKLKDHFKDLEKYEEVIVHCGSGITGCVNFVALDEIGINSKLYVGSWSDWISYSENEIAKGDE